VASKPNPRLRAAWARQAERVAEAAGIVRGAGTINDDVRRRLADLLEVCARTAQYEALNVHVQDKVAALSDELRRAQQPQTPRACPPGDSIL
jgi:hypothetical protein